MATAFQANAFQSVVLAFQIDVVPPPPTGGQGMYGDGEGRRSRAKGGSRSGGVYHQPTQAEVDQLVRLLFPEKKKKPKPKEVIREKIVALLRDEEPLAAPVVQMVDEYLLSLTQFMSDMQANRERLAAMIDMAAQLQAAIEEDDEEAFLLIAMLS